jgi:hypothetical protein
MEGRPSRFPAIGVLEWSRNKGEEGKCGSCGAVYGSGLSLKGRSVDSGCTPNRDRPLLSRLEAQALRRPVMTMRTGSAELTVALEVPFRQLVNALLGRG